CMSLDPCVDYSQFFRRGTQASDTTLSLMRRLQAAVRPGKDRKRRLIVHGQNVTCENRRQKRKFCARGCQHQNEAASEQPAGLDEDILNARLSCRCIDHQFIVVAFSTNAVMATRHNHHMDGFEPYAATLKVACG